MKKLNLCTIKRFAEHLEKREGEEKSLSVFQLNKLNVENASDIRTAHQLAPDRGEDVYEVGKRLQTISWAPPRSFPGLLFEAGLEVGTPYVVTWEYEYPEGVLACIPRVVEDSQMVDYIGHIHWSETALRILGLWATTPVSVWRTDSGEVTVKPVIRPAKESETKLNVDFSKFTDRARRVAGLALQAGQRRNSTHINTGLILIGLAEEGRGVAANVLHIVLGAKRGEMNKKVAQAYDSFAHTPSNSSSMGGKILWCSKMREALETASQEAALLNHSYIGTEHLLLGVIAQEESIAGQMFANLGVPLKEVREEVFLMLGIQDSEM